MKLIIVNGLPGTGKTTIAQPLALKLGLPLISKDTIKEFLFDTVGLGDREWSKMLGKASSEFLYSVTDDLLANDKSVIIESAFELSFATRKIQSYIDKYNPDIIEIYLMTKQDTRRQRFIDRNESGVRHVGHVDQANYLKENEAEPYEKYEPLNLGKLIKIDTTNSPVNLGQLINEIQKF
jgi:cytidylate kinase